MPNTLTPKERTELGIKMFNPGRVVFTPGVRDVLGFCYQLLIPVYLGRHLAGDWGDIDDSDKRLNDQALKNGDRLLSVYTVGTDTGDEKMYVITEWDRSVTTFLLPEEY
jgi:hypothetical protein